MWSVSFLTISLAWLCFHAFCVPSGTVSHHKISIPQVTFPWGSPSQQQPGTWYSFLHHLLALSWTFVHWGFGEILSSNLRLWVVEVVNAFLPCGWGLVSRGGQFGLPANCGRQDSVSLSLLPRLFPVIPEYWMSWNYLRISKLIPWACWKLRLFSGKEGLGM